MIYNYKFRLSTKKTLSNVELYQTFPLNARLDSGDASEERLVKADVVVLAAGAWCPYLGELAGGVYIPVIPVLGIMWSTPAQKTNQAGSMGCHRYKANP